MVLHAVTAASTNPIAYGCASQILAPTDGAASISITITLQAIEQCGDSILQPPETCDPPTPTDAGAFVACSSTCQTVEQLLSTGSSTNGSDGSLTMTGASGEKRNPAFVWPLSSNFLAFFTDDTLTNTAQSEQISLRVLGPTLAPTSTPGSILYADSIFLPDELPSEADAFPPPAEAYNHMQPVAVTSNNLTYVVYAYNAEGGPSGIFLRAMDETLDAEEANPCPVSDSTAGESGVLTAPTVAVLTVNGSDVLFIAWQDDSGRIYGRTYPTSATGGCGTAGTQYLLSTGSNNSLVSVAAAGTFPNEGWVAVWQSGTDVVVRSVNTVGV